MARRQPIEDPDNVKEAVLEGFRSVDRGDFIEIRTEDDARRFFEDIARRGKQRLATKRAAGQRAGRKNP